MSPLTSSSIKNLSSVVLSSGESDSAPGYSPHLITYLIRCGLYPGAESDSPDERTTDDKFLMELEVSGDTKTIKDLLLKTGASEINEKDS